jgi:hypothetical protein
MADLAQVSAARSAAPSPVRTRSRRSCCGKARTRDRCRRRKGSSSRRGARISVEASLWARFEGDKAREVHHYLDVLTLLQQIGAMPGPPA